MDVATREHTALGRMGCGAGASVGCMVAIALKPYFLTFAAELQPDVLRPPRTYSMIGTPDLESVLRKQGILIVTD